MYQGKFKNKKSDIFIIAILRCLRSHVLTKEYTSHTFSVIIYTFLPRCDSISSTSLDGFQSCFKPRWIMPLNIHVSFHLVSCIWLTYMHSWTFWMVLDNFFRGFGWVFSLCSSHFSPTWLSNGTRSGNNIGIWNMILSIHYLPCKNLIESYYHY